MQPTQPGDNGEKIVIPLFEIVVYPDAQHGFNADYRPSYDKAAVG
jgi:dienelactone hydrolase